MRLYKGEIQVIDDSDMIIVDFIGGGVHTFIQNGEWIQNGRPVGSYVICDGNGEEIPEYSDFQFSRTRDNRFFIETAENYGYYAEIYRNKTAAAADDQTEDGDMNELKRLDEYMDDNGLTAEYIPDETGETFGKLNIAGNLYPVKMTLDIDIPDELCEFVNIGGTDYHFVSDDFILL